MQTLFTPWRYTYITQSKEAAAECFFCAAARRPEDPESLVVWTAGHHLVMLNLHPYSSGHLMVAPLEHLASPQESDAEARAEFWPLVLTAHRTLAAAYSPDGFNLGMNLGAPAGAGVPGHFHFHVVPRWAGDTNFMTVLAEVRLVPEDLRPSRERLRALFRGRRRVAEPTREAQAAPEEQAAPVGNPWVAAVSPGWCPGPGTATWDGGGGRSPSSSWWRPRWPSAGAPRQPLPAVPGQPLSSWRRSAPWAWGCPTSCSAISRATPAR